MKPNTSRSRSARNTLVATTMALAVAGSALVAGPATADAPTAGGDWGFSNIGRNIDVSYNALPVNPTLVGNYPTAFGAFSIPGTTNTYGYCIELGVVSGGGVLPNQTISGVKGAESNYIIETYGSYAKLGAPSLNSGKDDQAAAVAVAIHETMDPQFALGWNWSTGNTNMADGINRHMSPTVRSLANQYKAAAKANAGPYTISTSITKNATNSGGTVSAKILSAAGNVQPGTITLTSDNQSIFPASGNNVTTVASGSSVTWKSVAMVSDDASLSVQAKSNSSFPTGSVITRTDGAGGQQNMLIQSGGSAPVGSANINGPLWREFTPNVTTKASAQVAGIGDELTDTLIVGVDAPNTWPTSATQGYPNLPANSTLYGPFNDKPVEAASAPAGAPVAGTTEVIVDGPGSYTTPGITPTAGGYYTWTETLGEGPLNAAVSSKFGVEEETTLIKWAPQITTETSSAVAVKGAELTDKLTVSGNQDGNKLDVTSTLYGPFEQQPVEGSTIAADAPVIGTVKTTVTGNQTVNTPALVVPAEGFYVWAETVPETPTTEPWVNDKVKKPETSIVKWSPEVTTETSKQIALAGETLTDKLTVTKNQPGNVLDVSSTLYGPFDVEPVEGDAIPKDAPKVGTVSTKVTGNETVSTPGLVVPSSGFYVWAETIAETPTTNPWINDKVKKPETSLVKWIPKVTTETSHTVAEREQPISDKLTVSDNQPGKELSVESTLYGPFDAKPEVGSVIAKDAPKVGSVTTKVVGNQTVNTPELVVPVSGYYVWAERIDESPTTAPWVNDKVLSEETTLVKWLPEVVTKTSNQVAEYGSEIFDTFTVSGNQKDQELTVITKLYGPMLDRPVLAPTEDHQNGDMKVPTNAKLIATIETVVKGNGEFKTTPVKLSAPGFYTWAETIADTDQTKPWVSDFGTKDETTVVKWSPDFSSQISDRSANVGSSVFDNVWADGLPINHGQTPLAPVYPEAETPSPMSLPSEPILDADGQDVSGYGFEMKAPFNQLDSKGKYKLPATWGVDTTDTLNAKVTFYGPFAEEPVQGADIPKGATKFSEVEVPVVNGAVVAAPFQKFSKAGWYTAVITVDGSDRVEAFTSDFGIPSETTHVPEVPVAPETPKTIAPSHTGEGASMMDTVSLSGAPLALGGFSLLALLGGLVTRRRNKAGQL